MEQKEDWIGLRVSGLRRSWLRLSRLSAILLVVKSRLERLVRACLQNCVQLPIMRYDTIMQGRDMVEGLHLWYGLECGSIGHVYDYSDTTVLQC